MWLSDLLTRLWWWLRRLLGLYERRPGPVTAVTLMIWRIQGMSNIRLKWKDPAVRADGSALGAADLSHIEVSMSTDAGETFTLLDLVPAGVQEFTQTDLPVGDYQFKLVAFDKQVPSLASAPVIVPATVVPPVIVLAAPGPVTDVTVEVEG